MFKKEREVWIDYAKFISIFLVVLFHTNPKLDSLPFEFFKLLRMPAFFLIAGLLFNIQKYNNFTEFIKLRFKRLIIPYCWFSLIFYLLWLLVGRNMVGEEEIAIKIYTPIQEFLLGSPNVVLAPYWFITCLFSIQIIFYFIRKFIHSDVLLLIITFCAYYIIIAFELYDLPWCLDKALLYFPFYAYANILKYHIKKINNKQVILLSISTVISLIGLIINYKFHLLLSPYITHTLYIMSGLCIIPIYIIFCKFIANRANYSKSISYIGENNIITLALQNYIIGFLKIICTIIFCTNILTTNYYIINVSIAIFTIIISMLFAYIINKYTPFIIGKSNK